MGAVERWNRDEIEEGQNEVDEDPVTGRRNEKAEHRLRRGNCTLQQDEHEVQERESDGQHQIRDDPGHRNPDISAPEIPELSGIDRDRLGPPEKHAAIREPQDHRNEKRPDRIQM
ncbi:MAG: hypothetical protein CME08_02255 [Gemmatimonadetes bacterium]|nr:hypothetical protein [Gemmatimonadota bacterium]